MLTERNITIYSEKKLFKFRKPRTIDIGNYSLINTENTHKISQKDIQEEVRKYVDTSNIRYATDINLEGEATDEALAKFNNNILKLLSGGFNGVIYGQNTEEIILTDNYVNKVLKGNRTKEIGLK